MKTMQQIIARVRGLLRNVGDIKLSDDAIRVEAHSLLTEYIQEESLAPRDRRTNVVEVQLVEDRIDYRVSLPGIADFEDQKLEFNNGGDWFAAVVVPIDAWEGHYGRGYVAASFYGRDRVRVSLPPEEVCGRCWRLTYREPLLNVMQLGDKPPLPLGHIPMFERELAIMLMPMVQDDSQTWIDWMSRALPLYTGKLLDLKKNWRDYLETSLEPQIQPIARFDDRRPARTRRAYVPMS